jgi:hypothetical protein
MFLASDSSESLAFKEGMCMAKLRPFGVRQQYPPDFCASVSGLLNHLIRQDEERRGERDPERLRRLAVEDQRELGGLLHGQVGRLGPFEDFGVPGVISGKFSVREMATKSPLVAVYDYIRKNNMLCSM